MFIVELRINLETRNRVCPSPFPLPRDEGGTKVREEWNRVAESVVVIK